MAVFDYNRCKTLFSRYQISITEEQFAKFSHFQQMMTEESSRQNVSAVNHPEEIWIRHFLDSAYLSSLISEKKPHTVLDLGTGGGFPGIPLAILFPELSITLLDSEERKLEYCARVVKTLGLKAKCLCGRAEELSKQARYREQFDMVTSRAVANGSMLCELAIPFLKVGGTFAAFKGSGYDPAVERFAEAAAALSANPPVVLDYQLEEVHKHLILIEKDVPTPPQYPRRFAKIKRSPL